MLYENSFYKIDIDVGKTMEYYSKAEEYSCPCKDCINFMAAVDRIPKEAIRYLRSFGLDPCKLMRVSSLCAENMQVLYDCTFRLVGSIINDKTQLFTQSGHKEAYRLEETETGGIVLTFSDNNLYFYPCDDFPDPCVEASFQCSLPWVLDIALFGRTERNSAIT